MEYVQERDMQTSTNDGHSRPGSFAKWSAESRRRSAESCNVIARSEISFGSEVDEGDKREDL